MAALVTTAASLLSQIYYSTVQPAPLSPGTNGPWRPPQWGNAASFAMTATDPTSGAQTAYVFDAILRAEHDQRAVVTENPVQTGAPITDHVYIVPPRVTIEIQMSDAMQSFTMGQWSSAPSRSVSCYQTLVKIMEAKNPVSLLTRLRSYTNMVVVSITAPDTDKTTYALNATVVFQKILTASVQTSTTTSANGSPANSALPQTTGGTLNGQVQSQSVPSSVTAQNNINSANPTLNDSISTVPSVPAAGSWSSTNISSISSTVG